MKILVSGVVGFGADTIFNRWYSIAIARFLLTQIAGVGVIRTFPIKYRRGNGFPNEIDLCERLEGVQ